MNAALIAACAANASGRSQNVCCVSTKSEELYYKVNIRKYFQFDAQTIVTPVREFYVRPYFNSEKRLEFRPVQLPAKTVAVEYQFSVKASECTSNIDSYIEANLAAIEKRAGWPEKERKIVAEYADEIYNKYSVSAMLGSLTYKTALYWEVS